MPTAREKEFAPLYRQLKTILNKHREGLKAATDKHGTYTLWTGYSERYKKPLYFGCVRSGKSYVSYHLMGIYMYPDLVREIPLELKKRMQGKSCFNFRKPDKSLFAELDRLTRKSRDRFKADGLV